MSLTTAKLSYTANTSSSFFGIHGHRIFVERPFLLESTIFEPIQLGAAPIWYQNRNSNPKNILVFFLTTSEYLSLFYMSEYLRVPMVKAVQAVQIKQNMQIKQIKSRSCRSSRSCGRKAEQRLNWSNHILNKYMPDKYI
ncbi:hypothetical protein YC2023_025803 [Brassica napus]